MLILREKFLIRILLETISWTFQLLFSDSTSRIHWMKSFNKWNKNTNLLEKSFFPSFLLSFKIGRRPIFKRWRIENDCYEKICVKGTGDQISNFCLKRFFFITKKNAKNLHFISILCRSSLFYDMSARHEQH